MKSNVLSPLVIATLAIVAAGCGADTPVPAPTAAPTDSSVEAPVDNPPEAPTDIPPAEIVKPEESIQMAPIRVGVQTNSLPPLVILNDGGYSGFSIDLAIEIVARVYGSETLIEWVPITSQERTSALADGQIDMLVRNLLHTVSREEQVLFSGGYLLSGNAFLVNQGAGYDTFSDLDGEIVAVRGFMQDSLKNTAVAGGYTYIPYGVDSSEAAFEALGSDNVKAIFDDWMSFPDFMNTNAHALILDDTQLAPFGIAFPLDGQELRDEVDIALGELISDGTWQSIFDKWFGIEVPWNVDEMFSYPPADR